MISPLGRRRPSWTAIGAGLVAVALIALVAFFTVLVPDVPITVAELLDSYGYESLKETFVVLKNEAAEVRRRLGLSPPAFPESADTSKEEPRTSRVSSFYHGVELVLGARRTDDAVVASADDLPAQPRSVIPAVDAGSPKEKIIAKGRAKLGALQHDPGFLAYLDAQGLDLGSEFRPSVGYIHLDLLDLRGLRVGSFAVEKGGGSLQVLDADDAPLGGLDPIFASGNSGSPVGIKRNVEGPRRPEPSPGTAARVFLLAGAHEQMTDTIVLLAVDENVREIRLVSIPRDLYFRGRKVNAVYQQFGAARLVREMEDLTGLEIDRYAVIDMYAFIDAVDALGGIDLTLDEDLVDPSYQVKVGGRWTTLFYPRGTHRLSGIETLRVARSRHLTSDFGRSKRQQDILHAIMRRVEGIGVADLGRLHRLIRVAITYVDTDMGPLEALGYAVRYRSFPVVSREIPDLDNSLYFTYGEEDGAYQLLPRDDDWEAFRGFVRSAIQGTRE